MYEFEKRFREMRHARHGYPIIRKIDESNDKFGPEEYKGYKITHTDDSKDFLVYAKGSREPICCETEAAAREYIDSQLDESMYDSNVNFNRVSVGDQVKFSIHDMQDEPPEVGDDFRVGPLVGVCTSRNDNEVYMDVEYNAFLKEAANSFDYKDVHVDYDDEDGTYVDSNGHRYMSYLSQDDIKSQIDRDKPTSINKNNQSSRKITYSKEDGCYIINDPEEGELMFDTRKDAQDYLDGNYIDEALSEDKPTGRWSLGNRFSKATIQLMTVGESTDEPIVFEGTLEDAVEYLRMNIDDITYDMDRYFEVKIDFGHGRHNNVEIYQEEDLGYFDRFFTESLGEDNSLGKSIGNKLSKASIRLMTVGGEDEPTVYRGDLNSAIEYLHDHIDDVEYDIDSYFYVEITHWNGREQDLEIYSEDDLEYVDTFFTESKEVTEALDDDPELADQEYSSAATSINSSKLPAIFNLVKFKSGSLNLDYGGGKFDNAAEYLESKYDATNLVYDPYNRTSEHNKDVLKQVRSNGGADTVTCSNVLNVIKEQTARLSVIKNCKNYLKSGGTAYFTVYTGDNSGEGRETKAGYQLNKKTADYIEEISSVFSNVQRKGKLIIAR